MFECVYVPRFSMKNKKLDWMEEYHIAKNFKTKMFDARVGATEQHLSEQHLRNSNPRCQAPTDHHSDNNESASGCGPEIARVCAAQRKTEDDLTRC